jgi:hypothetical protein
MSKIAVIALLFGTVLFAYIFYIVNKTAKDVQKIESFQVAETAPPPKDEVKPVAVVDVPPKT